MTGIDPGIKGIVQRLDMLTNTAKPYCYIREILIKHGRIFRPDRALPVDKPGPPKRCFHNSMRAAFAHDHLTYVEGFASAFFPTEHAWCTDADGSLYETTWPKPGDAYLGIPFKRGVVAQVSETNEFAIASGFILGSRLLFDWLENGFDESLTVDVGEPLPNLNDM